MKTRGNAIKFGNNIDTDVIIPARYLNIRDASELASHCMEDIDKTFVQRVKIGDIIVAGNNFGCGSSREHAPLVIKENGISLVVAQSFARIFFRNAINIGLPIIECNVCVSDIGEGDLLEVDFEQGEIFNVTANKSYSVEPFPPFIQKIIKSGGLLKMGD